VCAPCWSSHESDQWTYTSIEKELTKQSQLMKGSFRI
jgi:hypothetical protein